jgi:hypothetical protein
LSTPTGNRQYWKDLRSTKPKAVTANKLSSFLNRLHISADALIKRHSLIILAKPCSVRGVRSEVTGRCIPQLHSFLWLGIVCPTGSAQSICTVVCYSCIVLQRPTLAATSPTAVASASLIVEYLNVRGPRRSNVADAGRGRAAKFEASVWTLDWLTTST